MNTINFEFGKWQAWSNNTGVALSDESIKELRYFITWDDVINWLFLNDDKTAARALHKHVKECTK